MDDSNFKILIKNSDIEKKIQEIAKFIDDKYENKSLVLVCVLKGAIKFYAKLLEHIRNKNIELDFMQVRSYSGTETTGEIKLSKDISTDIKGKDVVLIEDIVDTGLTANFLCEHLKEFSPKSLIMCTLVQKPEKLRVKLEMPLIVGFKIENKFIIGYGLDLDEKYRNLNDILMLKD